MDLVRRREENLSFSIYQHLLAQKIMMTVINFPTTKKFFPLFLSIFYNFLVLCIIFITLRVYLSYYSYRKRHNFFILSSIYIFGQNICLLVGKLLLCSRGRGGSENDSYVDVPRLSTTQTEVNCSVVAGSEGFVCDSAGLERQLLASRVSSWIASVSEAKVSLPSKARLHS